ncbi:MAG: hypothetical protein SGJ02_10365 [bacterium]|nr:hypothetical protein [bacterium]
MAKVLVEHALVEGSSNTFAEETLHHTQTLNEVIFQSSVEGWMERCLSEEPENLATFQQLERIGLVAMREVSPHELKEKADFGQLKFREEKIFGGELNKITLPLDPERSGNNPVIIIRVESENAFIIMNGNHRVHKILNQKETEHPLLAVVFENPAVYEAVFGLEIKRMPDGSIGYSDPIFELGPRRR